MQQRRDVENEQLAENLRSTEAAPNDLDAIFSYARNGRRRKLEDALARGFNIDAEDEFGNTLIIIAAQQVCTRRMPARIVYVFMRACVCARVCIIIITSICIHRLMLYALGLTTHVFL